MGRRAVILAAVTVVALFLPSPVARAVPPPNFVFILTDDQPVGTLSGMPNAQALANGGARFSSAIISNPLCCPSRASILTGLYSHHTGVYTNGDGRDPWGGYPAFVANDDENRTFPLALQNAGYQTGLFGKYLNHYDGTPQIGWDEFHSFVEPNGAYYDYAWTINGAAPISRGSAAADYSTDVAGSEADAWLRTLDPSTPFFLYYSPYAPHGPTTPAPVDTGLTTTTQFSTPAYNEVDVTDKPRYIQALPPLSDSASTTLANRWNRQYATLLSVDRWIGTFRQTLADEGVLDRTIFIFLSDNGQTFGDHRWDYKLVPYERSIKVPFVMSGPGIVPRLIPKVVMNVDLAPTILDLAGAPEMASDGLSLQPVLSATSRLARSGVLLEHKNFGVHHPVPDYCGFRTASWMFARYDDDNGTQEEELYNLVRDPDELRNVVSLKTTKAATLRNKTYLNGCDPSIVPAP